MCCKNITCLSVSLLRICQVLFVSCKTVFLGYDKLLFYGLYVFRTLQYRDSTPDMSKDYFFGHRLTTGPGTHPDFLLFSVYEGKCRAGVRRMFRMCEAVTFLPITPFPNQVEEYIFLCCCWFEYTDNFVVANRYITETHQKKQYCMGRKRSSH
jgi:hypothetical protein